MPLPRLSPHGDTESAPAEEPSIFFCGCCRVPVYSTEQLTSVRLPRNVLCFGCGEAHISKMDVCADCLSAAKEENLSALTKMAYGESRPERRRMARFLISALKSQQVMT